jgi:hypothetical protein
MKLTLPASLSIAFFFFLSIASFSQVSIQSTKGYSVNVNIVPEELIINSNNCKWGYNYNIRFSYTVTFTGPNKPKSLYTLQGNISNNTDIHFFQLQKKEGSGTDKTTSNVWRGVNDCATVTLATMNLTTVTLFVEGDGINFAAVSFPLVVALPVKLVDFSIKENQQYVKLNWTTATETDNDFFTVERSTNENDWTAIQKVKGAGNSSSLLSYEAYDYAPVNGKAFYRLKQTDIDGTVTYSDIKVVNRTEAAKGLSIFPVPNIGNTINIAGINDYKNFDLQVLNAGGHILFSSVLSKSSIELPSLVAGIYFVRVKNKVTGEATNLRYVKI